MFRVHENVLRQSPFFANALKPEWVLARGGKPIDLEEENPDTFAAYVQWLYSHQVDHQYPDEVEWAKKYVFGEKMMDREFQDDVMNAMLGTWIDKGEFPADVEMISTIYNGTPEGSPVRKLLVDFWRYADNAKDGFVRLDYARKAPADFVSDLLIAIFTAKQYPLTEEFDWHERRASYLFGRKK